jgi:hypothetical protein
MIMDAVIKVMARNGHAGMYVAEVLSEAALHDPQFRDRMAAWAHIDRFACPAFELTVSALGSRRLP